MKQDGVGDPVTLYPASGNLPEVSGKYMGMVNGKEVYKVDDIAVNQRIVKDDAKKDFVKGGTNSVYDFIPKGQIWVADGAKPNDIPKIAVHEAVECHLMENFGAAYDKPNEGNSVPAHEIANTVEHTWDRITDGDVRSMSPVDADANPQRSATPDFVDGPEQPQWKRDTMQPDKEQPFTKESADKVPPTGEPVTQLSKIRDQAAGVFHELRSILSPDTASSEARKYRQLHGEEMARAHVWDTASEKALRAVDGILYKINPKERMDLMYAADEGKEPVGRTPEETSAMKGLVAAIRKQNEADVKLAQSVGTLKEFYENYIPHLFKHRPENDAILGKIINKSFAQGGFLKKRKFEFLREAVAAGCEPITDKITDVALIRSCQVHEFVAKKNLLNDMKSNGLAKMIPVGYDEYMPNGFEYVNDPSFLVAHKPDEGITLFEAQDKVAFEGLQDIAGALGIKGKRQIEMPSKGIMGYTNLETHEVFTKFGTPVSTLAHEIGHNIAKMFGLTEFINKGDHSNLGIKMTKEELNKEWNAIADLRVEGQEISEKHRENYIHRQEEKEAVLLQAWIGAPEKMKDVAPNITEIWKKFLEVNKPLTPLLGLKRGIALDTNDTKIEQPGQRVLGRFAVPHDVAVMINIQLSNGLRANENKLVSGSYNLARYFGNAMNQASMSFSAFHAINTGLDSISSGIGVGIQKAVRGDITGAGKQLAGAISEPISAVLQGRALKKAILEGTSDPVMADMVSSAYEAGVSLSMDPQYKNQSMRAFKDSMYDLRHSSAMKMIPNAVKSGVHGLFAAMELAASPIMEHLVPNLKLGVFCELVKDIKSRSESKDFTETQRREQYVQAWNSVENRMGQLNYDHLYWNQYLRDVAMLGVRSTGWNLGSIREFGGALTDVSDIKGRKERGGEALSGKQAYLLGCMATYATVGGLINYAFGQKITEAKDYFFPKTGKKNPDGSDERISLPTYAKDWYSWSSHPTETALHKMHPMWGTISEEFLNKDYYGTEIRNENDPWMTQFTSSVSHVLEAFAPISTKNFARMHEAGNPTAKSVIMSGIGISSAPSYITQSAAMKKANEYLKGKIPSGALTAEQSERAKNKKGFIKEVRANSGLEEKYEANMNPGEIKKAAKTAEMEPIQAKVNSLSLEQALNVYKAAAREGSIKEMNLIRPMLIRKIKHTKNINDKLYKDLSDTLTEE